MAVSDDIEARVRRAVVQALGLAVAGLVCAVAAGFLVAAMYLALCTVMEPVYACLATAGALLLIVIAILGLASQAASRRAVAPPRWPPDNPSLAALLAGEQLAGSAKHWLASHPRKSVIGVFALGFAVGFSPRLRRTLLRWLRG